MRRTLRVAAAIAALSTVLSAPALAAPPTVEIWHSELVFAGQGHCSAHFTVDAGYQDTPLAGLTVHFRGVDAQGKAVVEDVLTFEGELGESTSTRYASAMHESEAACESDLRIEITQALAIADGRPVQVQMVPRDFRPYRISVR